MITKPKAHKKTRRYLSITFPLPKTLKPKAASVSPKINIRDELRTSYCKNISSFNKIDVLSTPQFHVLTTADADARWSNLICMVKACKLIDHLPAIGYPSLPAHRRMCNSLATDRNQTCQALSRNIMFPRIAFVHSINQGKITTVTIT